MQVSKGDLFVYSSVLQMGAFKYQNFKKIRGTLKSQLNRNLNRKSCSLMTSYFWFNKKLKFHQRDHCRLCEIVRVFFDYMQVIYTSF